MATSYTALSQELEIVMADLERGDLDIDAAVERYKRGLKIVKELEAYLTRAEHTVTELRSDELEDSEEE